MRLSAARPVPRPEARRVSALRAAASAAVLALLGASGCAPRAASAREPDPPQRTIHDGVYTALQARYGASVFNGSCSRCHSNSEWRNDGFLRSWSGQTLEELVLLIVETMPPRRGGSLSAQDYVDVTTYLLHLNNLPTGDVELTPDSEVLRSILIVQTPPDSL